MITFLNIIMKVLLFFGFCLSTISGFAISLIHDQIIIGLIFLGVGFILFWLLFHIDEITGNEQPRQW